MKRKIEDVIITVVRCYYWLLHNFFWKPYGKIRKWWYKNKSLEYSMRKDVKRLKKWFYNE